MVLNKCRLKSLLAFFLMFVLLLVTLLNIWAADDTKGIIAFVSYDRATKAGDICLINENGSNKRRLTTDLIADDTLPVWSPDGKQIAFLSNRDKDSAIYNLYVMNADGLNQRRLTSIRVAYDRVSWSPDGKQIGFAGQGEKDKVWNWEIYVINVDGTNLKRLTNNNVDDRRPAWSPDGTKIAFVGNGQSRRIKIESNTYPAREHTLYLIKLDDLNVVDLVKFKLQEYKDIKLIKSFYPFTWPMWSPDSKEILFELSCDYTCECCNKLRGAIGVVDVESKNIRLLTNSKCCEGIPCWSPDGKKIFFASRKGGYLKLPFTYTWSWCLIDPDGKNKKELLKKIPYDFTSGVCWSPNGKRIAVTFLFGKRRADWCNVLGGEFTSAIYLINLDSHFNILKRLTAEDPKGVNYRHPAWSPVTDESTVPIPSPKQSQPEEEKKSSSIIIK